MDDIGAGAIDCIIVKDLSRFGRNFVEAGRYIDQIFPSLGIRFIAVNDNVDSARKRSQSDNILLPFMNLVNDAFCRDISIKIRSQFEIKRKKGDFIGSFAVFGYKKDPSDHHKLVIDDFAANVVRDIFKWKIDGESQQHIANKLNERGVLSPSEYKRSCGVPAMGFQSAKPKWTAVAVGRILKNECYIGTLVQGKVTTPNHKVKKTIQKPQEEWIRIEHNHPAIIAENDFTIVNRLALQDTRVAPNESAVYLFAGLLFCSDCGENMVKNSTYKNGKMYVYYVCRANMLTKQCSSHRIPEQLVYDTVLAALQTHISMLLQMEKTLAFIATLPYQQEEVQKVDMQLIKKQEEVERYQQLKLSLYESLNNELLDKAEYLGMKALYDAKLRDARNAIAVLKKDEEQLLQNSSQVTLWIEEFKKYQNIDSLNRRIVVTLIERIIIHEGKRIDIRFQYQDAYDRALHFIENIEKLHPSEAADYMEREAI